MSYDLSSVRLTLDGKPVAMMALPLEELDTTALAAAFHEEQHAKAMRPDTLVVHPQHAERLLAAMTVTPEDEARIERARAKRARRAAARLGAHDLAR